MAVLAAVLIGASLLVDPRAEAAFDAPKRLVAILGTVVAAAALLVFPGRSSEPRWSWRRASPVQRVCLALAALALAGTLISAVLSPRRGVALDSARLVLLLALLVPLGASRALARGRSRILAGAFVGAGVANATASVLQYSGMLRLFQVEVVGGRRDVSAFVGNDGVLALALALACVLCVAVVLPARRPAIRLAGAAVVLLFLAGLAVNQSLTALMALAGGAIVPIVMLPRRRALVPIVAVAVLGAVVTLQPALAGRARDAVAAVRAGQWDAVLSYRLGPWAAAVEMARDRPLLGWGPGTFGAEFVDHRVQAELRFRRRLVNPFLVGAYAEAHSDYLQAMAEVGLPAGLAAIAAAGVLAAGLLRVAWRQEESRWRSEAIVLLAVLGAGAAAAVAWFPLQRPITAVPLLLALGRAWRLSAGEERAGEA